MTIIDIIRQWRTEGNRIIETIYGSGKGVRARRLLAAPLLSDLWGIGFDESLSHENTVGRRPSV